MVKKIWFVVLTLTVGCSTSHDPAREPVIGDYLPLIKGFTVIYHVDSVVTSQNIESPYAYDLKVQVTDSFPATGGYYTYVLQRSKRTNSSTAWSTMATWSATVTGSDATVMEGNIPFVKIEAPIQEAKTWNGNRLNTLGGNDRCPNSTMADCNLYTLHNTWKPYAAQSLNFANTVTVIEHDDENALSKDVQVEVYALGVGLVYRQITQLQYCESCDDVLFVTKGLTYTQSVTQYDGH